MKKLILVTGGQGRFSKILNQKGILNVGGKSQSVYSFAKSNYKKVKNIKTNKKNKLPLNPTMNLSKLKKIIIN